MGLLLQDRSPLLLYSLLFAAGIATGIATSYVIVRLPEPPASERTAGFLHAVAGALRRANMVRFMVLLAASSFVASMALPFLVVFVKRAYGQGDDVAMLLTVIGSVGAILVALISGFVIDRVGAKPLMSVFTATLTIAIVLVVVAPPLAHPRAVWLYLGAVFFLTTFAANGIASAHSVYYFNLVRPGGAPQPGRVQFPGYRHSRRTGFAGGRGDPERPCGHRRTGNGPASIACITAASSSRTAASRCSRHASTGSVPAPCTTCWPSSSPRASSARSRCCTG